MFCFVIQTMTEKVYIPKIIHQVWMDKYEWDNQEPPEKYKARGFPQSWKEQNPDFEYIFWNKRMIYQLFDDPDLQKYKPFFFGRLKKKGHMTQCDFARYIIMFKHGGVYMDLDFKCVKNIGKLIEKRELLLFWEPKEHGEDYDHGVSPRLCVGFIGSSKGHPFWLEWMDEISNHFSFQKTIHFNTGPTGLSEFFQKKHYHIDHPEWIGNTCDVMANNAWGELSSNCKLNYSNHSKDWYKFHSSKAGITEPFKDIYSYNIWHEGGSGWGKKSIKTFTNQKQNSSQQSSSSQPFSKSLYTNQTINASNTSIILAIVLPFTIIVILIIAISLSFAVPSIKTT